MHLNVFHVDTDSTAKKSTMSVEHRCCCCCCSCSCCFCCCCCNRMSYCEWLQRPFNGLNSSEEQCLNEMAFCKNFCRNISRQWGNWNILLLRREMWFMEKRRISRSWSRNDPNKTSSCCSFLMLVQKTLWGLKTLTFLRLRDRFCSF